MFLASKKLCPYCQSPVRPKNLFKPQCNSCHEKLIRKPTFISSFFWIFVLQSLVAIMAITLNQLIWVFIFGYFIIFGPHFSGEFEKPIDQKDWRSVTRLLKDSFLGALGGTIMFLAIFVTSLAVFGFDQMRTFLKF